MNLSDLKSFALVAEHGSFSAAARVLGVPKSTVSRRVGRLEDALGVPLVARRARAVGLTDDGRRLHMRSAAALQELSDVGRELIERSEAPRGTLRITAAADAAQGGFFTAVIAAYRARHPEVRVELELTNRMVDLVEEGFDAAFRPSAELQRHGGALMGRKLAEALGGLWGAPDYLARRGRPEQPDDLHQHDIVGHPALFRRALQLQGEHSTEAVDLSAAVLVNSFAVVRQAIAAGLGIGIVPTIGHALPGAERVLPQWSFRQTILWLVWPAARHASPRLRAFVDLVSEFDLEDYLGP